ncbi:hypothetical protein DHEL01_v203858 [Diaporthe helianthi]|uniref:Uncharacterized protein n=1 Tax=Diaporthe helianthi TaxID=158607 RepID=A0A2P5I5H7_DIAHE|nr:hypothetical protein DHEL01_v203858 [Diaporthe helianthi]
MNVSDRLALTERVDHASEDEVKRALRYMILNCQVHHTTIARAIKDGIERFTPAPTIVYGNRDGKHDDEAVPASSHGKSADKEEGPSSSSSEDEDVPATHSRHHRGTGRRDKKTKSNLQGKSKKSGEKNVSRRDSSKRKKSKKKAKHARGNQIEAQENNSDDSVGRTSSKKTNSTVIDLVTSSDVEIPEKEQAGNPITDKPAADEVLDRVTSSEEEPLYTSAAKKTPHPNVVLLDRSYGSGDGVFTRKQHDFIARADTPSQGGSRAKTPQSAERTGTFGRRSKVVIASAAKTSNRHNDTRTGPLGLDSKRKAPDPAVGDVHTNQSVDPVPVIHPSKRLRQNDPPQVEESQGGNDCDKCEETFLSIHELMKHRWTCKGKAAAVDDHHLLGPQPNDQLHRSKQSQKAGNPAGGSVATEPRNIVPIAFSHGPS